MFLWVTASWGIFFLGMAVGFVLSRILPPYK